MKIHFGIPATGSSRDKGVALPLHRESLKPETQNEKSAREPFRYFGYWDFKGKRGFSLPLHRETMKWKMWKKCPGAISAFRLPGLQRTKELLYSTAFRNPETRNAKKHPGAILTFWLPRIQRTKGWFLCFQTWPPSMKEVVNVYWAGGWDLCWTHKWRVWKGPGVISPWYPCMQVPLQEPCWVKMASDEGVPSRFDWGACTC